MPEWPLPQEKEQPVEDELQSSCSASANAATRKRMAEGGSKSRALANASGTPTNAMSVDAAAATGESRASGVKRKRGGLDLEAAPPSKRARVLSMHRDPKDKYKGETTLDYMFCESADELAPAAAADNGKQDDANEQVESAAALTARLEEDVFGVGALRRTASFPGLATCWLWLVLMYARSGKFRRVVDMVSMH